MPARIRANVIVTQKGKKCEKISAVIKAPMPEIHLRGEGAGPV
jgi:hypothetical protein